MIICPQCGGNEYVSIPVVTLQLTGNKIEINEQVKTIFSCIGCGHRVETKQDIEPETVTVYIIGNSHSGMRQGLNRIIKKDYEFDFFLANKSLSAMGYYEIGGAWIFTLSQWKKFKDGEIIPLSEKPHKIEEINLT